MPAAKKYNAGTIFLQVVPVFDDVMRSITRDAKDINKALGDEMEKGGRDAGERAGKAMGEEMSKQAKESGEKASTAYAGAFQSKLRGNLKGVQRELDALNFDTLSDSAKGNFDRIKRLAKDIDLELTADMDDKKVLGKLEFLRASVNELTKGKHELHVDANLRELLGKFDGAIAHIEAETKKRREFHFGVDVDRKQLDRAMGSFEKKFRDTAKRAAESLGDSINPEIAKLKKRLDALADSEIGIDISSAAAMAEIKKIEAELDVLSRKEADPGVSVDIASATAKLAAVTQAVRVLDGKRAEIKVDVDTGDATVRLGLMNTLLAAFRPRAAGVSSASENAANSFRSFNFRILGAVTLLPALIPMLGALGGGLLALLPILGSVGAGLGVMVLGFSGIGDAVTALGDVQDNAAKDSLASSKTMRTAANSVESAQRGVQRATQSAAQANADAARAVADARRQAADAIEDALDRQKDAAEDYRDAVRDVKDAEADLRDARKQAADEIKNRKNDAAQNALDERQGLIDVFNAQVAYNSVMSDGSSTNLDKEQADIALEQAQLRLKEIRQEEKRLAAQQKKDRKEGIEGTDTFQNAQDALTQALEDQKDAQEALGDAAEAVNDARIQGARSVADAVRNQQRTEAAGAQSVADAQRALTDAQAGYGEALEQTGELGSASMQKLEQAMDKLGPAGRKFARWLFGLRDEFYALRDSVQAAMLPGVQAGLQSIIDTYGPQFESFATRMGGVLGDLFQRAGQGLGEEPWREFFATYSKLAPNLLKVFGDTTGNWMSVFARVMTIAAPYAERLNLALLGMSESALDFVESAEGTKFFTDFLDYAQRVGPDVATFFANLALALGNLGRGLAPYAEQVLKVLDAILGYIADLDPSTLGSIATAIIAIVIAMQAAVGVSSLVLAGASIFATAAGTFVFGFVVVAAAVLLAYHRFETFRDIVNALGGFMLEHRDILLKVAGALAVVWAAMRTYRAITATVTAVQLGWAAAMGGTKLAADAATASTKAYSLAMARFRLASILTTVAIWAQNAALLASPFTWVAIAVIALIVAIVLLWRNNETFRRIVTAAWNKIKDVAVAAFGAMSDALVAAWDYMKPVFEAIGEVVKWLWKNVFFRYFTLLFKFYRGIFRGMKIAWTHILWPVFDLIATVVWKLWKTYFKVAFAGIKLAWKILVEAIKAYWKFYLKPVFDVIKSVVQFLWRKVFSPILGWIGDKFGDMVRGFKIAWDKWGKPLFEGIRNTVLPKLKSAFKTTVEAIGKIWDGLKKIVGTPIKFVIDDVINKGLVKGFNVIAKFVGSDPMKELPVPDWTESYATGGVRARDGGVTPGYTPGQDVHHFVSPTGGRLNLSGGEAIMRPEFTAAVGPNWVHQMNAAARAGGVSNVRRVLSGEQSFWLGGVLPLPGATSISQHASGYSYPWAGDLNWPGRADYGKPIVAWKKGIAHPFDYGIDDSYGRGQVIDHGTATTMYAHMSRVLTELAGKMVQAGQTIGYVGDYGNTGNPPTSHLHFEIRGPGSGLDMADNSPGGKPQHNLPGWAERLIGNPLDWAKGLISKPIDALKDKFGGGDMIDMIAQVPVKLVKAVANKVVDIIPGKGAWDAAGHLIKDVGGKAGDIAGDVGGAISSGAGALGDALGLKTGGIIPNNGTMMYDNGGYLPPGLTTVVNLTGKPEPVFTNDQWDSMGSADGLDGFTYAPTFLASDLTASDVADDLDFEIRKQRRKGKYGKQG